MVAGGSSGLGRATAQRCAADGAHVVVLGRRQDAAVTAASAVGGTAYQCDVSDRALLAAVTDEILAARGAIHGAVSYAGVASGGLLADLAAETVRPVVESHLLAGLWFVQQMARAMTASGGGSLLLCSSATARCPAAGQAVYSGAKAALEQVARVAALEYGPDGIRVNCISPSLGETAASERVFRRGLNVEALRLQTPLGRIGTADEVADLAAFLLSDEACFITGQVIAVDGGLSTQKMPAATDFELLAARSTSYHA
ncbi:MAG TPA: SDR family oxidoreductase [Acidimicrobiia bacterium]|nr:SDR family oxidoreductase [Acidimicrobiia bacterium]